MLLLSFTHKLEYPLLHLDPSVDGCFSLFVEECEV